MGAAFTIYYIMRSQGLNLEESYNLVQSKKAVHPSWGFMGQLAVLELDLLSKAKKEPGLKSATWLMDYIAAVLESMKNKYEAVEGSLRMLPLLQNYQKRNWILCS